MMVEIPALWTLAPVLFGKMGQIGWCVGFPGQDVATVPLIAQNLYNPAGGPFDVA